jgi:hypothetical protein
VSEGDLPCAMKRRGKGGKLLPAISPRPLGEISWGYPHFDGERFAFQGEGARDDNPHSWRVPPRGGSAPGMDFREFLSDRAGSTTILTGREWVLTGWVPGMMTPTPGGCLLGVGMPREWTFTSFYRIGLGVPPF